ncbi:uncharacterized protein A1O9_06080 [Exophiala aquamarina CBS 119918]|uniref:Uncharacterized protein n=1 Tax=Exophiala aquamarina CBS 119918 TaxID=1182545 RepID=A0A072PE75_9EURO|nr:uncharacterized protein A1O9_06080 [Exophiala aquamarina CBS 119918]KEF58156.1 hypothetical protein A1O9_06080 [Exophiala aquamarina CBS 119918]
MTPQCDLYNGYFYVTPQNYTWQLQCTTNYEGDIVFVGDSVGFGACINTCIDHNRATAPGACLAVTFNGPNDGAVGSCTLWSDISNVLLAYEEGNIQDSAVLIFGANGEAFATPQADPSFSGAPTQPPTVVPLPTSTTAADPVTLSSPSPATSPSLQTILTVLTVTTTGTWVVYITSCPAGIQNCLLESSTSVTATSTSTTSHYDYIPSTTTTMTSTYITDGGSRPATTVPTSRWIESLTPLTVTSQTSTNRASGSVLIDPIQATYRNVVHYTEYRIQIVEVCAATSTPCSRSSIQATVVGARTEVSCSPGLCSGLHVATGLTAKVAATGICIRL